MASRMCESGLWEGCAGVVGGLALVWRSLVTVS